MELLGRKVLVFIFARRSRDHGHFLGAMLADTSGPSQPPGDGWRRKKRNERRDDDDERRPSDKVARKMPKSCKSERRAEDDPKYKRFRSLVQAVDKKEMSVQAAIGAVRRHVIGLHEGDWVVSELFRSHRMIDLILEQMGALHNHCDMDFEREAEVEQIQAALPKSSASRDNTAQAHRDVRRGVAQLKKIEGRSSPGAADSEDGFDLGSVKESNEVTDFERRMFEPRRR